MPSSPRHIQLRRVRVRAFVRHAHNAARVVRELHLELVLERRPLLCSAARVTSVRRAKRNPRWHYWAATTAKGPRARHTRRARKELAIVSLCEAHQKKFATMALEGGNHSARSPNQRNTTDRAQPSKRPRSEAKAAQPANNKKKSHIPMPTRRRGQCRWGHLLGSVRD